MPDRGCKPNFAYVYDANDQELKALEEFIIIKEKCIVKLMYMERNLHAIEDTKWLMQHLKEFLKKDKSIAWKQPQFLPADVEVHAHASMEQHGSALEEIQPLPSNIDTLEIGSTILDHLPLILEKEYFEPRQGKPQNTTSKPSKTQ